MRENESIARQRSYIREWTGQGESSLILLEEPFVCEIACPMYCTNGVR